jgi:hypothetical protein
MFTRRRISSIVTSSSALQSPTQARCASAPRAPARSSRKPTSRAASARIATARAALAEGVEVDSFRLLPDPHLLCMVSPGESSSCPFTPAPGAQVAVGANTTSATATEDCPPPPLPVTPADLANAVALAFLSSRDSWLRAGIAPPCGDRTTGPDGRRHELTVFAGPPRLLPLLLDTVCSGQYRVNPISRRGNPISPCCIPKVVAAAMTAAGGSSLDRAAGSNRRRPRSRRRRCRVRDPGRLRRFRCGLDSGFRRNDAVTLPRGEHASEATAANQALD